MRGKVGNLESTPRVELVALATGRIGSNGEAASRSRNGDLLYREGDGRAANTALSGWFWAGLFALLSIGAVLAMFAAIRGAQSVVVGAAGKSGIPPVVVEAIRVVVSPGESIVVDAAALAEARLQVLEQFDARQAESARILAAIMNQELEGIFARVEARIPAFADWYYSLAGEYLRLFNAAFGDLPTFLSQRLDELVFEPAGTARDIDALSRNLGEISVVQVEDTLGGLQDSLAQLIRKQATTSDRVRVTAEWDLSGQVGTQLQPYLALTPEDFARQGVAASVGAAAGVVVAKKVGGSTVAKAGAKLAAKPSATAVGALAARLGIKSAAKVGGAFGSAGTGAATGAAVCAGTVAGVPLSPACALIGGAVSGLTLWLLVDKAVIKADEHLNREEFEAGLREALAEEREALRAELKAGYIDGVGAVLAQIRSDLEEALEPRPIAPRRDFVPARAVARGEP